MRSTLESYRFEIEQSGFQFEQKIDNDVPPLWVDREAIARSLLNLVNNAVKYSSNEKYLGVRLYRQLAPGLGAVVPGMPGGSMQIAVYGHSPGFHVRPQMSLIVRSLRSFIGHNS